MDLPPPVQYVTTRDGISIAYTVCGNGPPLLFVPNLINHVLLSWEVPHLGEWLRGLAERFMLVRYDSRGMGMSTRGLPKGHVFDDYQIDLEAVLDRLRLGRFVLCAMGGGSQIAVRYAARHPELVSALVFIGGASPGQGPRGVEPIFRSLPRQDWEMFLHTAASSNIASSADVARTVDIYRQSVTQEEWLNTGLGTYRDSEAMLTSLTVPTLVLHPRDFVALAVESSMKVAQLCRGRLVVIDGADSHGDASQGVRAIDSFLADLSAHSTPDLDMAPVELSPREVEVLRLVAAGRTNQQIADDLFISLNTVRRHLTNIFAKTGAANRAGAASYAHLHSLT